jgi:hypothetical protein
MHVASLIAIAFLCPASGFARSSLLSDVIYMPANLLGTLCGLALFRRLNDRQFFIAVNLMLMLSGASLVV